MQKQQENEEESAATMDSFLCPSFSTYSSNNINDVAEQVTKENDNSLSQNDIDDFEFVAFQNHRRNATHDVFPIFNRHDGSEKRNSDAAEISISLKKLLSGDEKKKLDGGERRNSDAAEISNSLKKLLIGDEKQNHVPSSELEDYLDEIPTKSYCLWTPKSPIASPMNSPIICKKSNSTGSSSNSSSSSRWKFLRLLRRSKSDGKESLIMLPPTKKENLKVNCSGNGSGERKIPKIARKKIPLTEKKTPVTVPAMEAFYGRKKEMRVKSYLPYKKELIGFSVGFNATNIGRGFPLHV